MLGRVQRNIDKSVGISIEELLRVRYHMEIFSLKSNCENDIYNSRIVH